ncbi:MAG: hypothetical protein EOP84_19995, partial [Verrucomicrobiaceae bacterium]
MTEFDGAPTLHNLHCSVTKQTERMIGRRRRAIVKQKVQTTARDILGVAKIALYVTNLLVGFEFGLPL